MVNLSKFLQKLLSVSTMKKSSRTQASIAAEIGVSRQTLSAWKRGGMDTSEANLPALRERAGTVAAKSATSQEIQAARLRKLRAEADKMEHALAVQRGDYISRADVRASAQEFGYFNKHLWMELENDIPPQAEGLTALQIAAVVRKIVRERMTQLSQFSGRLEIDPTAGKGAGD